MKFMINQIRRVLRSIQVPMGYKLLLLLLPAPPNLAPTSTCACLGLNLHTDINVICENIGNRPPYRCFSAKWFRHTLSV